MSAYAFASEMGVAYATYLKVENGSVPVRHVTLSFLAESLGIDVNLLYYPTDKYGRLTDDESIEPVITLFLQAGLRGIIRSEHELRTIFCDRIADILLDKFKE
jgi:transcriptional regulator with XRE-family HTH domain